MFESYKDYKKELDIIFPYVNVLQSPVFEQQFLFMYALYDERPVRLSIKFTKHLMLKAVTPIIIKDSITAVEESALLELARLYQQNNILLKDVHMQILLQQIKYFIKNNKNGIIFPHIYFYNKNKIMYTIQEIHARDDPAVVKLLQDTS